MKKNDKSKNEGNFTQPLQKKSNDPDDNLMEMFIQIEKENSIVIPEPILDIKDVSTKRRKKRKDSQLDKFHKKSFGMEEEELEIELGDDNFQERVCRGVPGGIRPDPL